MVNKSSILLSLISCSIMASEANHIVIGQEVDIDKFNLVSFDKKAQNGQFIAVQNVGKWIYGQLTGNYGDYASVRITQIRGNLYDADQIRMLQEKKE